MLEELTNVSDEKHRTFFRDYFTEWGVHAAKSVITMPKTEEEMRHVMGLYERHGHPGCTGSIDCVHVAWDRCKSGMQALCTGKEKVPTLVFQVACTHTKRILSCSQWFFGTYNDKTISKYDPVVEYLESEVCKKIEWTALDEDENREVVERKEKGVYFLCDGGYHLWDTLIPPYKDQIEGTSMMEWSKHVESSRKDIECVFGILKKRFLFLKHPIRFQSPEIIHRTFLTCCVLHNLLLDFDGFDNWEYQLHDDEEDANAAYGTIETLALLRKKNSRKSNVSIESGISRAAYCRNGPGNGISIDMSHNIPDKRPQHARKKENFHKRRNILVNHFRVMKKRRLLHSSLC